MHEAPPLKPGDVVAIAAPSASFDKKAFLRGIKRLQAWGFRPRYRQDIFARYRYFAGSERRRVHELQAYLDDPQLKAILFARGGFGLHQILPELNLQAFRRAPKRVIGYSDLTLLLDRIQSETAVLTYYGPTVSNLGRKHSAAFLRQYRDLLTGERERREWSLVRSTVIRPGRAQGKLVGGCLSLLSVSIGTAFEVQTRSSILLLEDTGEAVYRIERMLQHLKQAGKLRGVRGILISDLNNGGQQSPRAIWVAMLREVLADFPGPVVYGFRCGHCPEPNILPLGARVILDTRKRRLSLAVQVVP